MTCNIRRNITLYVMAIIALLVVSFAALAGDDRVLHADKVEFTSGSYNTTLKSGTLAGNITLSLPATVGSAGAFLASDGAGVASWGLINATSPLSYNTGTYNLSLPVATSISNGYLSSADWVAFNAKQQAITIGAISGTSTANGLALSSGTLNLTAADGTNGGALTAGTQTIGGAKTFSGDVTLSANLTYSVSNDNTTTGSNANVTHTTTFVRLTNGSLVSIATLTQATNGHVVDLLNATGNSITIINDYATPSGGTSAIKTGSGANIVLADGAGMSLVYSSTGQYWRNFGTAYPLASSTQPGILSAANWSTFNSKASSGANSDITSLTATTSIGINSSTPVAALDVDGSKTASGGIARGSYFHPTLVAAANNDKLYGMYISPTYTPGAYTGLDRGALKVDALNNGGGLFINYDQTNNAIAVQRSTDSAYLWYLDGSLNIQSTGGMVGKDGSASGPTYSFGSYTTTGIYAKSGPGVGFSTGGSERMSISSTGVVVNGGLRYNAGTKPSCSSSDQGLSWYEKGGTGVTDTFYLCMKSAADTYNWIAVITGG